MLVKQNTMKLRTLARRVSLREAAMMSAGGSTGLRAGAGTSTCKVGFLLVGAAPSNVTDASISAIRFRTGIAPVCPDTAAELHLPSATYLPFAYWLVPDHR